MPAATPGAGRARSQRSKSPKTPARPGSRPSSRRRPRPTAGHAGKRAPGVRPNCWRARPTAQATGSRWSRSGTRWATATTRPGPTRSLKGGAPPAHQRHHLAAMSRRLLLLVGITTVIGICVLALGLTAAIAVFFHDNPCDPGGARTRAVLADPVLTVAVPSGSRSSLHVSAPHNDLLFPQCQQGRVEVRFGGRLDAAYEELHEGIPGAGWSL